MQTTLSREIPIFPLGTVLFPGGMLPLKVFEQRYIEMTKACLRDNSPFGVCLIREGREVGTPALPHTIGCLATIAEWDMPQLGLFHLLARGAERFRIVETAVAANGLITAEVDTLPPEAPAAADPDCRKVLELVIGKAGATNFPTPLRLDDAAWVAYRLAEILPIEPASRQVLLEIQDADTRSRVLHKVLAENGLIA
jgi:uncharacterized protein